jgi:hypothetical protein
VAPHLVSQYNPVNDNFKVSSVRGVTVSAWVNRPATAFSIVGVIGIAGRFSYTSGPYRQYSLSANNAATYTLWARASEDGLDGTPEFFVAQGGNANNTWYHVTGTFVNGSQMLYRNGVSVGTPATRASLPSLDSAWAEHPFAIAKLDPYTGNAQFWNGIIDEVRLFHGVRSAAWVRLEYQNQQANDSLVVNGAVVAQQTGAPTNLTYSPGNSTYSTTLAITPNVASVTGVVDSITVSPTLPAGLSLNKSTGVITGTPTTATAAANYTVTARNASGTATAQANITVITLPAPSAFTYKVNPVVFTAGVTITPDTAVVTGVVDSFTVSPTLPFGLVVNKNTGILFGTPAAASPASNYTVTAHNASGTATVQLNITINPPASLAHSRGAGMEFGVSKAGKGLVFRLPAGEGFMVSLTDARGVLIWSHRASAAGIPASLVWDGNDRNGRQAAPGTYVARIVSLGGRGTTWEKIVSLAH